MRKKYSELRDAKLSPKTRARAQARAQEILTEMALTELRAAFELSQEALAKKMKMRQSSISKIENNTDMFISTLRYYIETLGGELEIRARFPNVEHDIKINQFSEIAEKKIA